VALLDGPAVSPYGNPIPGLDELGGPPPAAGAHDAGLPLTRLTAGGGVLDVVVGRIGELIQTDVEALAILADAGLLPGRVVQVHGAVAGGPLLVQDGAGVSVRVPVDVAEHVFATAAPTAVEAADPQPAPTAVAAAIGHG